MENFWRRNANWGVLGTDRAHQVPAPQLPKRPTVRVRALGRTDGSPSFMLDGAPVQPGKMVNIDRDDALRLVAVGKAEYA
jgi:hypothetical protein